MKIATSVHFRVLRNRDRTVFLYFTFKATYRQKCPGRCIDPWRRAPEVYLKIEKSLPTTSLLLPPPHHIHPPPSSSPHPSSSSLLTTSLLLLPPPHHIPPPPSSSPHPSSLLLTTGVFAISALKRAKNTIYNTGSILLGLAATGLCIDHLNVSNKKC